MGKEPFFTRLDYVEDGHEQNAILPFVFKKVEVPKVITPGALNSQNPFTRRPSFRTHVGRSCFHLTYSRYKVSNRTGGRTVHPEIISLESENSAS